MSDKLDAIVGLQKDLMTRLGVPTVGDDKVTTFWTKEMALACLAELAEIIDAAQFKHWKKAKPINREALKMEWIDMLHFVIEGMLILGMDADEIAKMYSWKNSENHNRQDKGY